MRLYVERGVANPRAAEVAVAAGFRLVRIVARQAEAERQRECDEATREVAGESLEVEPSKWRKARHEAVQLLGRFVSFTGGGAVADSLQSPALQAEAALSAAINPVPIGDCQSAINQVVVGY